jgi:hypothetical protein
VSPDNSDGELDDEPISFVEAVSAAMTRFIEDEFIPT